jgi:hypothetical protein
MPGVYVLIETEAVNPEIANGAQPPTVLDRSKGLSGVLNQRNAPSPANVPKGVRSGSLTVQVCDQDLTGPAVN